MKIAVYPADSHGCGNLRMVWPAQALAKSGHDVTVVWPNKGAAQTALGFRGPVNNLKGATDANGDTVNASYPVGVDVMVLQRLTHRNIAQSVKLWRAKGIAVVIDIDDDLSTIHPSNPAFAGLHPREGKKNFSWEWALQACLDATLVTVSTPALLDRYAPHGRGVVIPNCVPESYLKVDHADSAVIGWGGSVPTHPDDLQVTGSAVSQVLTETGTQFRVVGPPNGVEEALRLKGQNWIATGGVPITQWPQALADNIGIGIAPLAATLFNRAKSALKPVEYSALGIPCVMSPRADYMRMHKLGIGLTANKPRDWLKHLRRLVTDPAERQERGAAAREVAAGWTIEGNQWRWLQAWTYARQLQDLSGVVSTTGRTRDTPRLSRS